MYDVQWDALSHFCSLTMGFVVLNSIFHVTSVRKNPQLPFMLDFTLESSPGNNECESVRIDIQLPTEVLIDFPCQDAKQLRVRVKEFDGTRQDDPGLHIRTKKIDVGGQPPHLASSSASGPRISVFGVRIAKALNALGTWMVNISPC